LGSGSQNGSALRGRVVTTEPLGAELLAHIEVAAEPVVTQEVLEVAGDVDRSLVQELEADAREHRTVLIGRFGIGSGVRPGDEVDVSVDTRFLHFFDLDSELAIRGEA
jgi:multiple sugar transport system ATP-binding protein